MTEPAATPEAGSSTVAGRAWQVAASVAVAALGFFTGFSPAGVSMALAVLLATVLLRPAVVLQARPWREPVMATGLLLLAYVTLHTLWVDGPRPLTAHTVNQYHELLFAPLLFALLQDARLRVLLWRGFVCGAIVLALAHWAALLNAPLASALESKRISAGFALALAAFLLVMRARPAPRPWPARVLAALLAATVLFAIEGRTGYVVLIVLATLAAAAHAPPRWRLLGAIAAPTLMVLVALNSSAVLNRLHETQAGSSLDSPSGPVTSTGIRIELMRLAADLSVKYAVHGAGYAHYPDVHEQAARERFGSDPARAGWLSAVWIRASNPHNEYAMQMVGGGAIGLVLFLAWLALPLRRARQAATPLGTMLTGAVLAFAVGSLFNSMLHDFVEGHAYMALLAWMLAEQRAATGARPVRRVVVIATRQIGDVLLTTPLIRAVRQHWPQAQIDVIGFERTLGMLVGNEDVHQLIEMPARSGWRETLAFMRRHWRRYDLALVTDPGDRAHLLGWLAAPQRSGIMPAEGGSIAWKRRLLDHAVTAAGDRGTVHVTVEKLQLLAPWAPELASSVPRVVPPRAAPLPADFAAALIPGAVAVHVPSMWDYKQWPITHYEALVRGLLAQGRQVVLTGSASMRDQACLATLKTLGSAPQLLDASGRLDFTQLVTLLQRCALYIGPDTSVSHLAAAVGLPLLAVFGPTNPMRWAPWPAVASAPVRFVRASAQQQAGNVSLVQGRLPCVPCGRAGCEDRRDSRSDCLADIRPERVLALATRLLARDELTAGQAG